LNERWILTSRSCTIIFPGKEYYVGYGTNDLVDMYDNNRYIEIEGYYRYGVSQIHKNEIKVNIKDQIALIKLKTPLKFNRNVQPACFAVEDQMVYNNSYVLKKIIYIRLLILI
jgi:hypothetical protein